MIKANAHKYEVSALCKVLNIPRSTYYYESKIKSDETALTVAVVDIFKIIRNNYGTRKIKKELADVLGVQRPSLFREFKKLKDEGLIAISNRTIKIIN